MNCEQLELNMMMNDDDTFCLLARMWPCFVGFAYLPENSSTDSG